MSVPGRPTEPTLVPAEPACSRRILAAAGLGLAAAMLLILFYRGFDRRDEGRYGEIAREMAAGGHWLEFRLLGYRYYEKPPLTYWLSALPIRLLGARDWVARLPLLLNSLALFAVFWTLARRHWTPEQGRLAAGVMAGMLGVVAGTGLLLTDAYLIVWFGLTCSLLFHGYGPEPGAAPRGRLILGAALAAALGVLTKGAVAAVLPGMILVFWLAWERRVKALCSRWTLAAAGLFLVVLAPVLLLVERHNPGFLFYFVFEEHLGRFLGTRAKQLHPEPAWYYLAILPLLALPWTLFAARAARQMVLRKGWRTDVLTRYALVWGTVVLGFFSAGTGKLMSYILPALPPLGLLLGRWGIAVPPDGSRRDAFLWRLGAAAFPLATAAILGLWAAAWFQWLPGRIFPIAGRSWISLLPAAGAAGWALGTGRWRRPDGLILWQSGLLLSVALMLTPLAGKDFNALLRNNSSQVFRHLAAALKPEDQVVVFWAYRPALAFYMERLYRPFQEEDELSYGIAMEPDRPGLIDSTAELQALLEQSTGRVFAVVAPVDLETRLRTLGLDAKPAGVPSDPDTVILELRRPGSARR